VTLSFLNLLQNWRKHAVVNLAFCCGAIWRWRQKLHNYTVSSMHNSPKDSLENLLPCMTFGAHRHVPSEPFLDCQCQLWQYQRYITTCGRKYIGAHLRSGPQSIALELIKISAIYMKWCAQKLCRFPEFSQFSIAISRKLWSYYIASKMSSL